MWCTNKNDFQFSDYRVLSTTEESKKIQICGSRGSRIVVENATKISYPLFILSSQFTIDNLSLNRFLDKGKEHRLSIIDVFLFFLNQTLVNSDFTFNERTFENPSQGYPRCWNQGIVSPLFFFTLLNAMEEKHNENNPSFFPPIFWRLHFMIRPTIVSSGII